jgi:GNAT superfamily N-acetyltransferase
MTDKVLIKTGKQNVTIHGSFIDDAIVNQFKQRFSPGYFRHHYVVSVKKRPALVAYLRSRGKTVEEKTSASLPPVTTMQPPLVKKRSRSPPALSPKKKKASSVEKVSKEMIRRGLECLEREKKAARRSVKSPPKKKKTEPRSVPPRAKSPPKAKADDELSIRLYGGKDKKKFMKLAEKLNDMCVDATTFLGVPETKLYDDEDWEELGDMPPGSEFAGYWNLTALDLDKKANDKKRQWFLYLARKAGKLVGFYLLERLDDWNREPDGPTHLLHLMCVPEEKRGQKIGAALLDHLKNKVLKSGDTVGVETASQRVRFYQRNGFGNFYQKGWTGSYTGMYHKD